MLRAVPFRKTRPRGNGCLIREADSPVRDFYLHDALIYEKERLCRTYDLIDENEDWFGFIALSNYLLTLDKDKGLAKIMNSKHISRYPPAVLLCDLFIKESCRNKGCGSEALWKAIQMLSLIHI